MSWREWPAGRSYVDRNGLYGATLELRLWVAGFVFDHDVDFVSETDLSSYEITSVNNYAPPIIAGTALTFARDATNELAYIGLPDGGWTITDLAAGDGSTTDVAGVAVVLKVTNDADSVPWIYDDGTLPVVAAGAGAATSDTELPIDPLYVDLADGVELVFSGGTTAVVDGAVSVGAREITVDALSGDIAAGEHAEVPSSATTFPYTTNTGGESFSYEPAAPSQVGP